MMDSGVNSARIYALTAHGEQRYGEFPYSVHLDAVAAIVRSYGEKAEKIAYLHDVVEDTSITVSDIEEQFGTFISRCVEILTDEPGETRRERKSATYKKMEAVHGEESVALLVKAADRLANVRACYGSKNERLLGVYKSEYKVFKRSAYRRDLCNSIWAELDVLMAI